METWRDGEIEWRSRGGVGMNMNMNMEMRVEGVRSEG